MRFWFLCLLWMAVYLGVDAGKRKVKRPAEKRVPVRPRGVGRSRQVAKLSALRKQGGKAEMFKSVPAGDIVAGLQKAYSSGKCKGILWAYSLSEVVPFRVKVNTPSRSKSKPAITVSVDGEGLWFHETGGTSKGLSKKEKKAGVRIENWAVAHRNSALVGAFPQVFAKDGGTTWTVQPCQLGQRPKNLAGGLNGEAIKEKGENRQDALAKSAEILRKGEIPLPNQKSA